MEQLRLFFRRKNHRRAGKLFMLFTFDDHLHRKTFYMFSVQTNKDILCNLIVTKIEMKLIHLKKKLKLIVCIIWNYFMQLMF